LFNLEDFDIKLDTDFIGRNFIYSEEVESTNSSLVNQTARYSNGTVLLAEKQTKGRGRRDRIWYSAKEQNLTFSILLSDKIFFRKNISLINFVASLSVAEALEYLYQIKSDLKWPNDILLNGKKTGGILIESTSKGSKVDAVIIGFGLNVNQTLFQGNFNLEPTSLKIETGHNIERERLLAEILNVFEDILKKSILHPNEIMKDWKLRCKLLGEKISINVGDTMKYGIFDDLDENGFLLLKSKGKIETITTGDVNIN
jgi:BirA family biotin operon repressor/biotin-[acetyl-CoA-carboxylase] ligase